MHNKRPLTNRNTNISIKDNDNNNGGEKTDVNTAHNPPLILAISRFPSSLSRACIIRVSKSQVWTFRSCRAAYTAMRDKDRAVLLLSCCLALCPVAPWQALAFYRVIVSLSNDRLSSSLSNYRSRTIIPKLSSFDTISNTINSAASLWGCFLLV